MTMRFNQYPSHPVRGNVQLLNFQKMCKVKPSVIDEVDAISTWQSDFLEREIEIANMEYQELKENELKHRDVINPNSK